jgi:hypothetical protein
MILPIKLFKYCCAFALAIEAILQVGHSAM